MIYTHISLFMVVLFEHNFHLYQISNWSPVYNNYHQYICLNILSQTWTIFKVIKVPSRIFSPVQKQPSLTHCTFFYTGSKPTIFNISISYSLCHHYPVKLVSVEVFLLPCLWLLLVLVLYLWLVTIHVCYLQIKVTTSVTQCLQCCIENIELLLHSVCNVV